MNFLLLMLLFGDDPTPKDFAESLPKIKRVFVDRLSGGETAAQMRDLIITALENTKLFVITEKEDRADAFIRGSAEDLIYTDQFQSSDGVNMHAGSSDSSGNSTDTRYNNSGAGISSRAARSMNAGIGGEESSNIKERKHEALATVRLVDKNGDVLWSTTQESKGGKFHGASADVADKIARQLMAEVEKAKKAVK